MVRLNGCVFLLIASIGVLTSFSQVLPEHFSYQKLITGLNQPVSLAFLPDGRMLIVQLEGEILIAEGPDYSSYSSYMTLVNVNSSRNSDIPNTRGIRDIAIDPDFRINGYVYVYYSSHNPQYFRISRFRHYEMNGGLTSYGDTSSETILWQDNEDYYNHFYHYGGGLDFGPDGKLYCSLGDKFRGYLDPYRGRRAQDTTLYAGKVLRINKDGSIPDGSDGYPSNPFVNGPGLDEIWALGLRNPFRASWDLVSGRYFIADVGSNEEYPTAWEDIHITKADSAYAGVNYGWPYCEGLPPFQYFPDCDIGGTLGEPLYSYEHGQNNGCIIGGVVYRGSNFPENPYYGAYFHADYVWGTVSYLTFNSNGKVTGNHAFGSGFHELVAIEQGQDGFLYFIHHSGAVSRVVYPLHPLSSYVIITGEEARLDKNTVYSGGIGATKRNGRIMLFNETIITALATFIRAKDIILDYSSQAAVQFHTPATVTLPSCPYGPSCDGPDLKVPQNASLVLPYSDYGNITIGNNSTVTFTAARLNIKNLTLKSNVTVMFANCANVKICGKLHIGEYGSVNPDGNKVMVYVEENINIQRGSTVNGEFCALGNIKINKAESHNPNIMRGRFIAQAVSAGNNTHWFLQNPDDDNCVNTISHETKHITEDSQYKNAGVAENQVVEKEIRLMAYPNPFSEELNIEFTISHDSRVQLQLFNFAGQQLAVVLDEVVTGNKPQKVVYNPVSVPGGLILIRLQTQEEVCYQKVVMAK